MNARRARVAVLGSAEWSEAPTALLGLLSPLVAALLGAVIAGEALSLIQISGFVIAFAAMVAGQFLPQRRAVVVDPGDRAILK